MRVNFLATILLLTLCLFRPTASAQSYCYFTQVTGNPQSCQNGASGTTTGAPGNQIFCSTTFVCTDSLYGPGSCLSPTNYDYISTTWTCTMGGTVSGSLGSNAWQGTAGGYADVNLNAYGASWSNKIGSNSLMCNTGYIQGDTFVAGDPC